MDGKAHTNTLENFWALLKRGIAGTYVSVEPFHLFRYLDEAAYRYNNRKGMNDYDRFKLAASQMVGKRLPGMRPLERTTNLPRTRTEQELQRQRRGKRKG